MLTNDFDKKIVLALLKIIFCKKKKNCYKENLVNFEHMQFSKEDAV